MTDAYLKSWLDRVENLEEEQKNIGGDKRDLYTEAKSKGYNPKALRRIVAARKRKDEKEIEADVETYKVALGIAVDLVRNDKLSLREAARKTGASKSSIQRALAVPKVSHNAAPQVDGMTDAKPQRPAPEGGEGTGANSELEQPGWSTDPQIKPALPAVAGDPLDRDCGGSIGARAASEEVPQETSGLPEVFGSPERAAQNSPAAEDDDLEPPPFLKRARPAVTA